MLILINRLLARARDRRGFTLIETLVAMVTGIIVTGALFAILEVSSKQTARISEVSQATAVGRTAMTHIVDELHSACLSNGFTPVLSGSNANKLVFVNGYFLKEAKVSETAEPEYTFVRKDAIEFASGKLTDTKYQATAEQTGGVYSSWKELGKVTLAENISNVESEPIFKYYTYNTTANTNTSEAASTLTPLTATEPVPGEVAAVQVSFRTGYYKKEVKLTSAAEKGISTDQTTLTTFALGAPNSETTIEDHACE